MNLFFIGPNKVKMLKMQRQVDLGEYKNIPGISTPAGLVPINV